MAEWKKVVVSGSNISQLNNDALYIANGASNVRLTGSFTGSFIGNLTGTASYASQALSSSYALSASRAETAGQVQNLLTIGEGLGGAASYNGSTAVTLTVSGAAQLTDNKIVKWNNTDGKFVDASLTDNGTTVTGTTSIQLSGANSSLSGSFSGSFTGNGAGLTGVTSSNLSFALSQSTGISAFSYNGSATAAVQVSGASSLSSNTVTKWTGNAFANTSITDNGTTVTVTNNTIFTKDLTVQGTASFQNTENLLVADRFALFASGSSTTGDGGIVIQQGTQNIGELFGYDSGTTRWGFTSSFNAASSTFTPSVYVGAVQTGTGQTAGSAAPIYGGVTYGLGTIHIDTDDSEIWIYA